MSPGYMRPAMSKKIFDGILASNHDEPVCNVTEDICHGPQPVIPTHSQGYY